jgi:hypothetical protein
VPLQIEILQLTLLGDGFLNVILAERALAESCDAADRADGLGF